MSDRKELQIDNKEGPNPDRLVLVIPSNATSDLLIMSFEEYQKFKRRGDITRENRKKKGLEDL